MDRRNFLKTAVAGTLAAGFATTASAERFFPQQVDQSLFQNINRVKDPAHKTPLETTHAPVIKAPASVKAGEPFTVEVSVGEKLHPMSPAHWIEAIELQLGNIPVGRADLQPHGYLAPKVAFTVIVPKDAAPSGKVTLVATERCSLHGYWESNLDIRVT